MAPCLDITKVEQVLIDSEKCIAKLERKNLSRSDLDQAADAYQNLCSIYAWLETYYPQTNETDEAARLIYKGRRLLYGQGNNNNEKLSYRRRIRASYQKIKNYVAFATAIAILSAGCAALMVKINPDIGWHFINEESAAQLRNGSLWTDQIQGMNSIASSQIATNNIKVTFLAFAAGISGGVLTVVLLVFNGALLGGIFATLAPYNMAHRLLEFILAHGFLELSIIAVGAGAGLYIGDGLIKPGTRTRKQALKERARPAIDLVLFSAAFLLPCGFVEGYISPNPNIPALAKLAVGLSICFIYWRTILGGKHKKKSEHRPGQTWTHSGAY